MLGAHKPGDRGPAGPVALSPALAAALLGGHDDDPAHDRIDAWTVIRRLGSGAAGDVYLAHGPAHPGLVALKILRHRPGEDGPRFWREGEASALAAAVADHPAVRDALAAPVATGFTADGRPYIAAPYIDGDDLLTHCESRALDLRARVSLLADLADAVDALHRAGLIHRDLKPSNVLVDRDARPRIVDFGLARLTHAHGATLTAEGGPIGTPAFMAPEQARGERGITTAADVHALGATGYLLLTGATPHDTAGVPLHAAVHRVAELEPRDPRSLRPSLPRDLASVLRTACERTPRRRYASAAALADDLRRWLRAEPVSATRRRWPRATAWMARHPVLTTGLACAALLVATAGSVAASLLWALHAPDRIVLSEDGRTAALVTPVGKRLHAWPTAGDRMLLAEMCRAPDGRDLAVLGFSPGEDPCTSGRLVVADARSPDKPVWTMPAGAPDVVSPTDAAPDDEYRLHLARTADVFPELPAQEIIAVLGHAREARVSVRVYDLDGVVRYEAWHWGRVESAVWLREPGLLVLAGVTNRADLRTLTSRACGESRKFPSVCALRPELGHRGGWIIGSQPGGAGDVRPRWYRVLADEHALCAAPGPPFHAELDRPRTGNRRLDAVGLELKGAGVFWSLSGEGETTFRTTGDVYADLRSRLGGTFPAAADLRWSDPDAFLAARQPRGNSPQNREPRP